MPFLFQQFERHPTGRAPIAAPLFGDAAEVERLILHPHPPFPYYRLELREGDRGIDVVAPFGQADPGVHDRRIRAI